MSLVRPAVHGLVMTTWGQPGAHKRMLRFVQASDQGKFNKLSQPSLKSGIDIEHETNGNKYDVI